MWRGWDGNEYEMHLWDGATTTTPITNNGTYECHPEEIPENFCVPAGNL
jgi:hypothetical protein